METLSVDIFCGFHIDEKSDLDLFDKSKTAVSLVGPPSEK